MNCPTCGQPTGEGRELTTAELEALSAWWATGQSVKGAANLLRRAPRTVINQLYSARIRNGVHTTVALVPIYLGSLRTMRELITSHNSRQEDAA